jgi:oligopeptide transport system ATP-binding protein
MADSDMLLEVRDIHVVFHGRRDLFDLVLRRVPSVARVVDGVDLTLHPAEAVGLVGESGCGKSTLARTILGLIAPTQGAVALDGFALSQDRTRQQRRRIQIVFQDPYASLNPRMSVQATIGEVLRFHNMVPRDNLNRRTLELLARVGLGAEVARAFPRQLSGGQRQRVSIARALALEPDVLVADEPVSALDVSVQLTVLNLLASLRKELGLALLLIAHDLAVVRQVCDRVAVMYLGRIVESAPTEELFENPRHPYTRALLDSVPTLRAKPITRQPAVIGDPPSPFRIPSGCRFNPRCSFVQDVCHVSDPPLMPLSSQTAADVPSAATHRAACHFVETLPPWRPSWTN